MLVFGGVTLSELKDQKSHQIAHDHPQTIEIRGS